jgi:hypothetical protein
MELVWGREGEKWMQNVIGKPEEIRRRVSKYVINGYKT